MASTAEYRFMLLTYYIYSLDISMCTPSLAIDAIIEVWPDSDNSGYSDIKKSSGSKVSLVLVNRGVPPKG